MLWNDDDDGWRKCWLMLVDDGWWWLKCSSNIHPSSSQCSDLIVELRSQTASCRVKASTFNRSSANLAWRQISRLHWGSACHTRPPKKGRIQSCARLFLFAALLQDQSGFDLRNWDVHRNFPKKKIWDFQETCWSMFNHDDLFSCHSMVTNTKLQAPSWYLDSILLMSWQGHQHQHNHNQVCQIYGANDDERSTWIKSTLRPTAIYMDEDFLESVLKPRLRLERIEITQLRISSPP